MHTGLAQRQTKTLLDDRGATRKLELNLRRNVEQDHTRLIDDAAARSAEPALLGGVLRPDRLRGDSHHLPQSGGGGGAVFTRGLSPRVRQPRPRDQAGARPHQRLQKGRRGGRARPFRRAAVHLPDAQPLRAHHGVRRHQRGARLLARGLRTLNGKLIQHQLSNYYMHHPDQERAPLPSAISYWHFMDESFHFNTSRLVGLEVPRSLEPPTAFERWVVNRGVAGCQRDHFHFSVVVNGIFWYDPATFPVIYKLFRSPVFAMDRDEAFAMMKACFAAESEGLASAAKTHGTAADSYRAFIEPVTWLDSRNREMRVMRQNSAEGYLERNRRALAAFRPS